jgi:hypothetical protein
MRLPNGNNGGNVTCRPRKPFQRRSKVENAPKDNAYPYADLSIPCPERSDRVTVFFRIFCAIPILILCILLAGVSSKQGTVIGGGFLFLPLILAILFRNKYPRTWFDWVYYLSRFSARIGAYLFLLRDEYPALEDDQCVKLELRYPNAATELHRGMPLVKWFLAIPHYIVLAVLFIAVLFVTIIAWFAILFTGKYPRTIHEFVVGVFRWCLRVNAYAFLLLTDKYPPFGL